VASKAKPALAVVFAQSSSHCVDIDFRRAVDKLTRAIIQYEIVFVERFGWRNRGFAEQAFLKSRLRPKGPRHLYLQVLPSGYSLRTICSAAAFQFRFAVIACEAAGCSSTCLRTVTRSLREVCCPSNTYFGRDQRVGFEVIGIALLGFGVGLAFRFNVLLAILLLLLFLSIGYSISHQFGLLKALLTIMGVQVIAQSSYFLGLVVRSWMNNPRRWVLV